MPRVIISSRINTTNLGKGGDSIASPNYQNDAQNRYMVLSSAGAPSVTLFYSPRETQHSALSTQWEEIPRSGQAPVVVNSGQLSERMSFECTMAMSQPGNITAELQSLRKMATSKDPITMSYTEWEGAGFWRITALSIDVVQRSSIDHAPIQANISLEFLSLSRGTSSTGMLTGGAATSGSTKGVPAIRKHVLKAGDTLWRLSQKYYGDGEKWTELAKANKISRPKYQLKVGKTLKIPYTPSSS